MSGRDLVRLSLACNKRLGRHLGLQNDLPPLLLRWGHSEEEMCRSLTCCPERNELLQTISPDWLAQNVPNFLIALLEAGGHMDKVTPDWLSTKIRWSNDLMYCLGTGNHLDTISPDWIVANLENDMNMTAALIEGGHLATVTPDWIFDNIKCYRDAFWALTEKLDITTLPHEFFKKRLPYFEDFAEVAESVGYMDSEAISWFIGVYDSQYRDDDWPAVDLAHALMHINILQNAQYDGCSFDVTELLTAMRNVPYKELYGLLDETMKVTGIVELCRSLNCELSTLECLEIYFVQLGWSSDSAYAKHSLRVICQFMLNKWVPQLP